MNGGQDPGAVPGRSTIRKLMIKKPSKLQFEIVSWLLLVETIAIVGFFGWMIYKLISL